MSIRNFIAAVLCIYIQSLCLSYTITYSLSRSLLLTTSILPALTLYFLSPLTLPCLLFLSCNVHRQTQPCRCTCVCPHGQRMRRWPSTAPHPRSRPPGPCSRWVLSLAKWMPIWATICDCVDRLAQQLCSNPKSMILLPVSLGASPCSRLVLTHSLVSPCLLNF